MTIQTRFLTQVAAATSEAEIDAVVDAADRDGDKPDSDLGVR